LRRRWIKEEIKRDYLLEFLEKVVPWVRKNKNNLLAIGGIILVCGGVFIYFLMYLSKLNALGWEKLAQVQGELERGLYTAALSSIEQIEKNYQRTKAAKIVSYYKGEIFYRQGDYQKAIESYTLFLEKSKNSYLAPLALSNIGACWEELKNYKKAEETYQTFLEKYPEHFLAPPIYLSLARCQLENKNKNQAQETYHRVTTLYPGSRWQEIAQGYLDTLKGKKEEEKKKPIKKEKGD
jgi:tetratricopeptide (TPR) repeat protein